MKTKHWYPTENGKSIIDIKVESIHQLFDERDPTPFRLRDLDDDAVEYIVASAMDIGPKKIGRIRVHCKEALNPEAHAVVAQAVHEHFLYRLEMANRKFYNVLRQGYKSLAIGLSFLSFAVFLSSFIGSNVTENFFTHLLKEGVLLLGWVSMWKPINIFLYEWWPLNDDAKLLKAISETQLELVQLNETSDSWQLSKKLIVSPHGNKIA